MHALNESSKRSTSTGNANNGFHVFFFLKKNKIEHWLHLKTPQKIWSFLFLLNLWNVRRILWLAKRLNDVLHATMFLLCVCSWNGDERNGNGNGNNKMKNNVYWKNLELEIRKIGGYVIKSLSCLIQIIDILNSEL